MRPITNRIVCAFLMSVCVDCGLPGVYSQDGMFTLDQQLQEAWNYFSDYENRRRDVAINKFNAYLRDHPDTIFLPEIYFRIGQLYSSHRNKKYGEQYDPDMMVKYYQLAVDSYGPGYSDSKYVAWASLVNQTGKTLKDRSEFYDWLCGWKDVNDPNMIYRVKSMEILAQGRSISPYWTQEEKVMGLGDLKKHLPRLISVAEKNILQKSTPAERLSIARLYPDTEMARQVQGQLNRSVNRLIDNEVKALTDAPVGTDVPEVNTFDARVRSPGVVQSLGQEQKDVRSGSSSTSDTQTASGSSTTMIWAIGCLGAVVLVSLLATMRRMRRCVDKKARQSITPE